MALSQPSFPRILPTGPAYPFFPRLIPSLGILLTSPHQPVGLFPGKYSLPGRKGDCSLAISNVDLRIDDGEWECQVRRRLNAS